LTKRFDNKELLIMPTMQDVAKKAGVALSTVSHALSGKRPVSDETRERIHQAIQELGFRPNELARRLANQQSKIIGLFFPRFRTGLSEMQLEFVSAAIDAAENHGYALLLWRSPTDVDALINLTHQGLVDGVIFMEVRINDDHMFHLKESGFPFCMMGRTKDNSGISFVDLDHTDAIVEAFNHLISLKHRQIAYIDYPQEMAETGYGPAVFCREGYQQAVQEHQLPIINAWCEPTSQDAYQVLKKLIKQNPDITALVTPNEAGLPGMYQAVQDAGKIIAKDFSILSLASLQRAERLFPTLTTMDFPTAQMGKLAVEILIKTLHHKVRKPVHKLLKSQLAVRQSTGPAPFAESTGK
jgi:DNA-binding LacI/PurR family transcriptional regulator